MSDAFRLEVFVDKDGTVYDEVVLDKVGDDTNKWDYLLDSKLHHINNLPSWMRRKLAVLKCVATTHLLRTYRRSVGA